MDLRRDLSLVLTVPDPPEALAVPYAGFVSRVAAGVIDTVVFAVLSGATLLFLQAFTAMIATKPFGDVAVEPGAAATVISVLLAAYFAGSWAVTGRTAGEAIMGLRVVRNDGRPVKLLRAYVRFMCAFVSLAACGIGFAWMLVDNRRRTWQDIVARTVVVYDFDEAGVHHGGQARNASSSLDSPRP